VSQARLRARAAHAAPRVAWDVLPSLSTTKPRHGRLLPAPLTALLLGAAGGGLALLAAIGPQSAPQIPAPVALTANDALAPAPLNDQWEDRAGRSRRAAAPDPEPVPVVTTPAAVPAAAKPEPAAPVLPDCDGRAHDVARYANGRLPDRVLCSLPGGSGERLRADAAVAFVRLAAAYEQELGQPVGLTDGYRPLAEQQQLRRLKPRFAARPGYSEHGWGLAVDLSCGVQSFRTPQHAWLVANAGTYGWFLPEWAQRGGARPEPWHWEFSGA
jgi:D-alanyl-D-alanine carboxypeptidase